MLAQARSRLIDRHQPAIGAVLVVCAADGSSAALKTKMTWRNFISG